jgi:hypothetical protein
MDDKKPYLYSFKAYLEMFEPRKAYISEMRLQYAWKRSLWKRKCYCGDGKEVWVLCPGRHNFSDGPDFMNSQVMIGEKLITGDIEIHHYASDWYAHGHHHDPAYNSCVLHVVFHPPGEKTYSIKKNKQVIPICYIPLEEVLDLPPEGSCVAHKVDPVLYFDILIKYGWLRVDQKIRYFYQNSMRFPGDVMLYWGIFKACGYRYNEENMINLFMSFPWENYCATRINVHDIKNILEELAGFGRNTEAANGINWTYSRTRPAHFPERRVQWLGNLLTRNFGKNISAILYEKYRQDDLRETMKILFDSDAESFIKQLCPGPAIRREIVLNTVLPLIESMRLAKRGESELGHKIRREILRATLPQTYGVADRFHELHGIDKKDKRKKNWLTSQGVLYIRDHFCCQDLQSCCPVCMLSKTTLKPVPGKMNFS